MVIISIESQIKIAINSYARSKWQIRYFIDKVKYKEGREQLQDAIN
jgi:hypothetical protein